MKIAELRQKTKNELEKLLQDNREKVRQLRFNLVAGKVKNVRELRKIKKEIARILTLLKKFNANDANSYANAANIRKPSPNGRGVR